MHAKRNFQKEFEIKLRNAKSTDPNQYWKLLDPRKPKCPNPVPVSEFYNFLKKNLNCRTDNTEIDLPNITDSIQELDHEFSDAEIIEVS